MACIALCCSPHAVMGVGYTMMKGSGLLGALFPALEASSELSLRLVSALNVPFASLLCQTSWFILGLDAKRKLKTSLRCGYFAC